MKLSIKYSCILLLWLCCTVASQAQTLNKGLLYVSPDTKVSIVDDFRNADSARVFNDGQMLLYGDLRNDGQLDYYFPGGNMDFIGMRPQQISGTEESFLYNVLFRNNSESAAFRLSGKLLINGQVDFRRGIIDSDSYGGFFSFGQEGNHRNASHASHVDGEVLKIGQEDFIFPIGDGGYFGSAAIADLAGNNVLSQGKYFLENSDELYPHRSRSSIIEFIDDREYWRIDKNTPGEVAITLNWNEAVTPEAITGQQERDALSIVRWDGAQQLWVDEGGAYNDWGVTTVIDQAGVFTLALKKVEQLLPCGLSIYNAITPNGDGINDFFRIEQGSQPCARNLHLQVFNRWGERIFEALDYGNGGPLFGQESREKITEGTYFYRLQYELQETGAGAGIFEKTGYIHVSLE